MVPRLVPDASLAPSSTRPAGVGDLDGTTLALAQAGDAEGCRAFMRHHERRVFTLCLRLLGDRASAEDAAADALSKSLLALPRFDPAGPAQLATWVLTIATRVCLDEQRRRRRRPAAELSPTVAGHGPRADDVAEHAGLKRRIHEALMTLSENHRAIFVLRVLEERSVEDTAQLLDIDAGTVKSRLSRARDALRIALREYA
jgi:RNA polymerase sigma-70 factor (ECF subfamily)